MGKQWLTLFFWAPKSLQLVIAAMKLNDACSLEEKIDSIFKSRDITLPTKVHLIKAMAFPSSHVWTWELDIKKAERWRTDAFELWCWRRLVSPLDYKEIQPIHPKGDQSWVFIGRTDVEADTLIHWPPDGKSWLTGKDPDAGKHWRWEEKGTTEDEMAGWHHWLNGHGFE